MPVAHFLRYCWIFTSIWEPKRWLLALDVKHNLIDFMHTRTQSLIVLSVFEKLEILISIVLIRTFHHEFIHHSLFDNFSLEHERITMLLNFSIVEGRLYHIAIEFQWSPHTLYLKWVIERKFLVDESEWVICPVMIETILREFWLSSRQIAVCHMTVRENDTTCWNMLLHTLD